MLIEFRLKNFRSYRDEQVFSLVANSGKELAENTIAVESLGDQRLLKSAAIYGANASGKSNLLLAVKFFLSFVSGSAARPAGAAIPVEPFGLDPEDSDRPSEFEATFLMDGVRHQYGFAVTRQAVVEEWLIVYPQRLPQHWFERDRDEEGQPRWSFSSHFRGAKQQLAKLTRPNALFLSTGAQLNHPQLTGVFLWIHDCLRFLRNETATLERWTEALCVQNEPLRSWLSRHISALDQGIAGITVDLLDAGREGDSLSENSNGSAKQGEEKSGTQELAVRTRRRLPGLTEEVAWGLDQESDGTRRVFGLLGIWYEVLQNGWVLFVDELDSSLHPLLSRRLVEIFNNPEVNPKGAQLVFTTHDTTLLDTTLLRRDQIWFTEKDKHGATHLYSLQDYHPRKSEAIQKGYLAGRYGAIPFFGELNF